MASPLTGVRILDLTTVLMGPFATQILAGLGADVLKVEAPSGDIARYIGQARNPGMGPIFLNVNGGKRSLAIDLKQSQGREAFLRLAGTADVLICNHRPQALRRLGLDYAPVRAAKPDIIYLSLVGFSRKGRYAGRAAYDDLIQAAAGIPRLLQEAGAGEPRYVPLAIADRFTGISAVNALLAAYIHRLRTGEGQEIEVPMFETLAQLVLADHMAGQVFEPPLGPARYSRLLSSNRRPFPTKDGHIAVMPYSDAHWQRFFELAGHADALAKDPRFADISNRTKNIDALYALVGELMPGRTTAEWMRLLEEADIPAMPLHSVDSLLEDAHLADVGFLQQQEHPTEGALKTISVPVHWSATPPTPPRPAPSLGQHSREILAEAGLVPAEIEALIAGGVVKVLPASGIWPATSRRRTRGRHKLPASARID